MKRKDWCFRDEKSICNFRSVGVLIKNNRMLVQCDNNEYALPGGHVAIGETSEETLIREYKEETGADIFCNRLIWVEETFWKWGSRDAHGIAFYYLISLKNDADIPDDSFVSQKDNCNIMLKWVSIEEMKQLTIYPSFIKDKIENISDGIEHFVSLE
ncbi:NUDIX hydrolase [Alkaliphilus peptidifermentans]|uniref:NUDIX domain-containing protein n=1 Tax=Alkaliphilus peptidifermentans DSM 18978 TaxID=1120976 RepID=A0A1G5L7Z1_9FIRM|nr:NUDIX domain-containing protein [Alkaliphilus peptidifermentans]SCZ08561.1 NUDIX domain-containing protein [Alkaliphilus peptidifermentans DSM 18978]